MSSIEWRPEVNALTVPPSYKIRYLPKDTVSTDGLAAEIAEENPVYNQGLVKAVATAMMRKIQQNLIRGNQVTIDEFFTFGLSFTGRLEGPDDPLPEMDEMLHVQVHALAPFVKEIRHQAQMERMPMVEKAPVINTAEDTRLKLDDVLYAEGMVQLTGTNLFSDEALAGWECVIEGTRSGRTVQSQLGPVSATSVLFVPDIPAQDAPYNNEYTISVSARYTENGSLRTGTYRRRLRSPLLVDDLDAEGGIGILTDTANLPYAAITGGAVSADEMLRIQAVFDPHNAHLLLRLIDMHEDGKTGAEVMVTANGVYTLNGFAGSAVTSLQITLDAYTELVELVRHGYSGRLVDILDIRLVVG